jgi:hypothetical protein
MKPDEEDDVIRISHGDAFSGHVDDLLKRQLSLRGELEGGRDRLGRWYYRNWFVFGVAGALAAALAWALIEPTFDDTFFMVGEIESLDRGSGSDALDLGNGQYLELSSSTIGSLQIAGQRILVPETALLRNPDGSNAPLELSTLEIGKRVGVHLECEARTRAGEVLAILRFLELEPSASPKAVDQASLASAVRKSDAAGMVIFAIVAAFIGLFIGCADGLVCRVLRRMLLGGLVGMLAGFIGGFVFSMLAGLIYLPLNKLALADFTGTKDSLTTGAILIQLGGRALAWCTAGMAMGLGQGIVLRSKRLFFYGFLGGTIGGLLGGLAFDPVDLLILGTDHPSAHWSRLIGFVAVGGSVGVMIGVVELLARDAWLRMVEGPLAGKEFLLFKDVMRLGSSPRSDMYLFSDDEVADQHAAIHAVGENYEIERLDAGHEVAVNGRSVSRSRLRHGDQIRIGRTSFTFQRRHAVG